MVIGCVALGVVLIVSTVRESYRGWQVDQEIHGLEQQIQAMEGKRGQLAEVMRRLQSGDAIDKEARTRLGLRKPGERVFVLQNNQGQNAAWDTVPTTDATNANEQKSNPRKWFAYFFFSHS